MKLKQTFENYGYLIILLTFVISLVCISVTYLDIHNTNKEYIKQQVNIYEENCIKLDKKREEYNNLLKKIEEENRVPTSYNASIPIFMYHFIRDETSGYMYPENMVKISSMEEQIKYLSENNYDTLFTSEIGKVYKYKKPVILTYDDGFNDVYYNVFPLLKKYNVKITMFVVDKFFDHTTGYCTIEQLNEMKKSGLVEIEAHTMTHPYLTSLSLKEATSEIVNIKESLKKKLNIISKSFCYPYGFQNRNIVNIVKQNYDYGFNMDGGIYYTNKHSKYEIPRIYVNRSMKMSAFIKYAEKANTDVEW